MAIEPKGPVSGAERGARWEALAREHLERHGLRLVEQNYRCPGGEIDLVMRDGEELVFVEVRFRRSVRYGCAAESVDQRKQGRLREAALSFLQRQRSNAPCRFDVVAIHSGGDAPALEWIRDAFCVEQ